MFWCQEHFYFVTRFAICILYLPTANVCPKGRRFVTLEADRNFSFLYAKLLAVSWRSSCRGRASEYRISCKMTEDGVSRFVTSVSVTKMEMKEKGKLYTVTNLPTLFCSVEWVVQKEMFSIIDLWYWGLSYEKISYCFPAVCCDTCFAKIFNTRSKDVINDCQFYFNWDCVTKRTNKFLCKCAQAENFLCVTICSL